MYVFSGASFYAPFVSKSVPSYAYFPKARYRQSKKLQTGNDEPVPIIPQKRKNATEKRKLFAANRKYCTNAQGIYQLFDDNMRKSQRKLPVFRDLDNILYN